MIRNDDSSTRKGFTIRPSPRPVICASAVAIQFAKLGGLRVLTTACSKNFDLVKGLGADEVFDYRDEGVVEKIRAATGDALNIAIDTISEGKTPELRLSRSPAPLATRVEKSPSSIPTRVRPTVKAYNVSIRLSISCGNA
ncbi:hypothetical protein F5888DRAFT_1892883 [Russula emetica]|nr:hypothetical protein F5888DRAFT_1892883 [Russula emetica]